MGRSRDSERSAKLREATRDAIREEIERAESGQRASASISDAVRDGLARAQTAGEQLGLELEDIDRITHDAARRVLADELQSGRRASKGSKSVTQILREAEGHSILERDRQHIR